MSTSVSSSTVTTATSGSGTTYISGTSGFDSSALIKAAVNARMQPAYTLDAAIKDAGTKVTSWQEMLTDLTAISDSLKPLSSAKGAVYSTFTAYLNSSTLTTPSSYVAATVTDGAAAGIYDVKIERLATTHKVAANAVATATTVGPGSFTLKAGTAEGATITLDKATSLSDLAKAINAQSATSGVSATLVKTSDNQSTLVLSATTTGVAITATDTDGLLAGLGLDSGDFTVDGESLKAKLTIDGVTVTSSTNDIKDLVPGVSLNLYAATGTGSITLEIGQDLSALKKQVETFVKAFNAYRTFALTQQATDENGAADTAILFGDGLLRSANSAIFDAINANTKVGGVTLANFGITMGTGNMLEIDDAALQKALLQDPKAIQAFFQTSSTSTSPDLGVYQAGGKVATGDYTVNVTVDGSGAVTGATINGVALAVNGTTLTGTTGSAYEGVTLVYTGKEAGTHTATLSISRGLADTMLSSLETYTNSSTGLIANKVANLNQTIATKQSRRDEIATSAASYEDQLVKYYARLEAQIQASKTTLQKIEALFFSKNND
ncbi:flagellar filament capping protein FliD [Rhodospirillum rubrum]|uniref:Flagellar hook-associated protein 2 n=1 Tax=Rhodospirillum rubrum (strain ATCC 11170 / ATH 1.1.1 / DSM 467 / LMG 4362 / NCIMB 8255 / S1) TaxID=269796 RepID=Q2RRB0_RHORT|nr:flagellar filament capping protein FliD [Rhodospirillum rubrum]ABC23335.1 Flagellar hook-associated protein 2 (FliD, filament cap protein) [Rhodospirillum rubrum ATCC 11170]AEO49068.1 flagellar hook-associated protein 2 (FliD, filament cap protein) [Rhodospirillum rubrum F11]MBK5954978.1 flagellar hook protein FliD [Rhodospirillum rubrum]QXG79308.1 flagellar filament capping protein FliD [Rhodospirillum rubrum]HAQ01271.1 flagellar hook protein FliD [Rhodospirillum rubrum]